MEAVVNIENSADLRFLPVRKPKSEHKKRRLSRRTRDYIFVIVMLFYPVIQFLFTWSFVNINSVIMAFQKGDIYGYEFVGFETFAKVIKESFVDPHGYNTTGIPWLNDASVIVLNSFGYAFITIFISLPLSLLFSYFLSKKMPFVNLFRIIFFLPNIIPVVALTFAWSLSFKPDVGYMFKILEGMGIKPVGMNQYPISQIMVYAYCIWAGLGYNVILFSGAIGRIPKELFESAKIDNCGYFKEFCHIIIPMIWPTIITLVILGMTNVLTLYLQPLFLTKGLGGTGTISLQIWDAVGTNNPKDLCEMSAKGLFFSVLWAPVILLTRKLMSKCYSGVDY